MTGPVQEDKSTNTITIQLKNNYKTALSLIGGQGKVHRCLGLIARKFWRWRAVCCFSAILIVSPLDIRADSYGLCSFCTPMPSLLASVCWTWAGSQNADGLWRDQFHRDFFADIPRMGDTQFGGGHRQW